MTAVDAWVNFAVPLLGALAGGVSAYVAIRADLSATKATLAILQQSVQRAHERIDSHIERGHGS